MDKITLELTRTQLNDIVAVMADELQRWKKHDAWQNEQLKRLINDLQRAESVRSDLQAELAELRGKP